jgi:hypothetical protein
MTMMKLYRLSILSILLLSGTNAFLSPENRRNHVLFSTVTEDAVSFSSSSTEVIGEKCDAGGTLLTETAMLQKQNFPISPKI